MSEKGYNTRSKAKELGKESETERKSRETKKEKKKKEKRTKSAPAVDRSPLEESREIQKQLQLQRLAASWQQSSLAGQIDPKQRKYPPVIRSPAVLIPQIKVEPEDKVTSTETVVDIHPTPAGAQPDPVSTSGIVDPILSDFALLQRYQGSSTPKGAEGGASPSAHPVPTASPIKHSQDELTTQDLKLHLPPTQGSLFTDEDTNEFAQKLDDITGLFDRDLAIGFGDLLGSSGDSIEKPKNQGDFSRTTRKLSIHDPSTPSTTSSVASSRKNSLQSQSSVPGSAPTQGTETESYKGDAQLPPTLDSSPDTYSFANPTIGTSRVLLGVSALREKQKDAESRSPAKLTVLAGTGAIAQQEKQKRDAERKHLDKIKEIENTYIELRIQKQKDLQKEFQAFCTSEQNKEESKKRKFTADSEARLNEIKVKADQAAKNLEEYYQKVADDKEKELKKLIADVDTKIKRKTEDEEHRLTTTLYELEQDARTELNAKKALLQEGRDSYAQQLEDENAALHKEIRQAAENERQRLERERDDLFKELVKEHQEREENLRQDAERERIESIEQWK